MAIKSKVTNTVFGGGGREDLAAPDIYNDTVPAESTISSFKSAVSEGTAKVGEMFKTSRFNAKDVVGMIDLKGGVGLNNSAAIRQLEGVTGARFDTTSGFIRSVQDKAVGALKEYTGYDATSLVDVTGRLIPLASGDITSARDLFGLVDDLVGSDFLSQFPDLQGQAALFGSIIDTFIELGVPDALDDLFEKIEDEEMRKEILISNCERVARAGDLDTLYEIKGLIGAADMKARVPLLVKYVMQGYRVRDRRTMKPHQETYDRMVTLFNEVDPQWAYTTRNGVRIGRTQCFATASEATKEIFTAVGEYVELALLAPSYPPTTFKSILKRDFKRIVV